MPKPIDVVGAVFVDNDMVLAAQRGPGMSMSGMWEFPGGKIEPDETPEQSLARELEEELGVQATVGKHVVTTDWEYDFGIVRLSTYYCSLDAGTPKATEHAELRWVSAEDLASLEWAPADIEAVNLVAEALQA